MDKLSQNNFDDLFREGSEKVEFEYREDAWAALDERLEAKERKRRLLWILLGLALSTLVIGSVLYYFNQAQNGTSEFNSIQENIAITEQKQEKTSTEQMTAEAVTTVIEKDINSSQIINQNVASSTSNKTAVKSNKTTNTDLTQGTLSTNNQTLEQENSNLSSINIQEEITPIEEDEKQLSKENIPSPNLAAENLGKTLVPSEIPAIKGLPVQELVTETKSQAQDVNEFVKEIKLLEGAKNQFSFGAFGSIDFNSLSLGQDKIEQGYRVGLRTDYNFARRFSLGIGAAFSRKTYTAQGFRYNAKPGFWVDGIAPIEVEATCNVIEVPLELRFYAKGHNQDGFFAGAGINSYHIALERYNFHYEEFCPDAINDWEERGTNTNFLSVASFTVGYQKTMNKNLALQVAPYINLPITGIGQGNVNLQSVGLNVAVNWRK